MSTIKSSNEHLTLNADGSSKDIKFQANGVEKASISSAGAFTSTTIDATKLTGDVPDASFPSTLPAASAANLTAIPAANITGTLPAISGANLTGLTSAQMPAGSVLQVVHTVYDTSYYNANSSSRTDITNFAATITPRSTTSKVLIIVHASMHLNCDGRLGVARNGTALYNHFIGTNRGVDDNDQATFAGTYLDSPTSTSAVVYQMYTIVPGCGNDAYINRSETGTTDNGRSGITLMEIAG